MKRLIVSLFILIGIVSQASAAIVLTGASGTIKTCIVLDEIAVESGSTSSKVLNCSLYNSAFSIEETTTITNCINNNVSRGRSINITTAKTVTGTYNCFSDSVKSGSGTYSDGSSTTKWSTDPKYLNQNNGDLHLLSKSPCIDAGIYVSELAGTLDIYNFAYPTFISEFNIGTSQQDFFSTSKWSGLSWSSSCWNSSAWQGAWN